MSNLRFVKTNRTNILSRPLIAFKPSGDCITILKKNGVVYIEECGCAYDFYPHRNITLTGTLKNLEDNIINLNTLYSSIYVTDRYTRDDIDFKYFIDKLSCNSLEELNLILSEMKDKSIKYTNFLKEFPDVPQGYIGWYEKQHVDD